MLAGGATDVAPAARARCTPRRSRSPVRWGAGVGCFFYDAMFAGVTPASIALLDPSGAVEASYSLTDAAVEGWTIASNPDGTTMQTLTLGFVAALVSQTRE